MPRQTDIEQLCRDNGIRYRVEQQGWLQMRCIFCSDPGRHLGINKVDGYANCYRCGWHSLVEFVATALHLDNHGAIRMLQQYQGRPVRRVGRQVVARGHVCKLPYGTGPLQDMHKVYLRNRDFADPDGLAALWGLQGTHHMGEYKFRIVAPVYYEGVLVSYECRDVTDQSETKVMGCKRNDEVVGRNTILYGMGQVPGHSVVVCEGAVDVWRLGPGAVHTFGADWSTAQVALLRKYDERFICYDNDSTGRERGAALAAALSAFPGHTEVVQVDAADPGELGPAVAKAMMEELIGGL